jgi:CheY-like chemotaxis protein
MAFVDLAMPGMNGEELARRLREEFPPEELALVAVSGYTLNCSEYCCPSTHRSIVMLKAAMGNGPV